MEQNKPTNRTGQENVTWYGLDARGMARVLDYVWESGTLEDDLWDELLEANGSPYRTTRHGAFVELECHDLRGNDWAISAAPYEPNAAECLEIIERACNEGKSNDFILCAVRDARKALGLPNESGAGMVDTVPTDAELARCRDLHGDD